MSSYISRVFARPQLSQAESPPTPSHDRETELNLGHQQHVIHETHPQTPIEDQPRASALRTIVETSSRAKASIAQAVEKPSEDQFQIMFSSILAQNSNLLAQNTEQARVIDRLSICLKEAEAGQKELREEMRGMFRGIMDILGQLKPAAEAAAGAGTPTSASADDSSTGVGAGSMVPVDGHAGGLDLRGLINSQLGITVGNEYDGDTPQRQFWSRDKGKGREVGDGQGIDPNALKRSFTALDTPTERGDHGGSEGMDIWNDNEDDGGDLLDPLARRQGRSSTVEGMSATQLSAIAQQVVDMQNQEDEAIPSAPNHRNSSYPTIPIPTTQEEDPTTPTRSGSGRPIRQSTSRSRNISSLLPDEQIEIPVERAKVEKKKKEPKVLGKKRGFKSKKEKVKEQHKAKKQRKFNGRVSMTARTLGRSDGQKRGEGLWPEKGQNTVKGTLQEIVCDTCNGRVHWACAGFQDSSVPPDEWDCPDCEVKIANGEPRVSIERSPQILCIRPNCVLRDKKKIIMEKGDSDEFVMEKYIGRRAVGRKPDGTSRIFEYLVKWLGWSGDTSTWEHEIKLPPNGQYADDFLAECEIYEVNTKKRVALLPEARKWFDDEGDEIGAEPDSAEEELDEDITGAGPSGAGLGHEDEKEDDEDRGSDEE